MPPVPPRIQGKKMSTYSFLPVQNFHIPSFTFYVSCTCILAIPTIIPRCCKSNIILYVFVVNISHSVSDLCVLFQYVNVTSSLFVHVTVQNHHHIASFIWTKIYFIFRFRYTDCLHYFSHSEFCWLFRIFNCC